MTTTTILLRVAAPAVCAIIGCPHATTAQTAPPPAATQAAPAPDTNAVYTLGPDSLERDGVPKGVLRGPFVLPDSTSYPGTQHTYWVHVPAQYDPAVEADLMIFQDGQAFIDMAGSARAPNVLDNLCPIAVSGNRDTTTINASGAMASSRTRRSADTRRSL